jgi:hypothetical protein
MEQLLTALKDYTAIIVACIAAAVSIINLFWSMHFNEKREQRKVLWERELNRFSELEDTAGRLIEDILSYRIRTESELSIANKKLQILRAATGSFLRYPNIASALRDVTHSSAWYIAQDMRHETRAEFEDAQNSVKTSFEKLVTAIDEALKNAPRKI